MRTLLSTALSALVSENGSSEARGRAPRFRLGITQDLAERALAGDADENRAAKCRQLVEPAQELEVVLDRLPEADARIEADRLFTDPLGDRKGEPFVENPDDLGDNVLVMRVGLHRPRLALHVHQAKVGVVLGDDACELGVAAQGGDVVHQLGS